MEESIVSIYDLLLKRQRQLRKEYIQSKTVVVATTSVESPVVEKAEAEGTTTTPTTMPITRTRVTREPRQHRNTAKANVISASHLTRKQTGLIIPSLHKRDVIDKLVARMTGGEVKKPIQTLPTAGAGAGARAGAGAQSTTGAAPAQTPMPPEASTESANQNAAEGVPAATKKVKVPNANSKSKKKKPSSKIADNVPKISQRRLALSPRNNLSNTKVERKQRNRTHVPFNIPIEVYPNSFRSKQRPKTRKSKMVISSNLDRISSDELNTVHYRV